MSWQSKVALVIGVSVFLAWLLPGLFPSDETRIRRSLKRLSETLTLSTEDGNISKISKASRFPGFFTTNVVVDLGENRWQGTALHGRSTLADAFKNTLFRLKTSQVEFKGTAVKVGPGKQSANVRLDAHATIDIEPQPLIWAFSLEFHKTNDGWKIHKATRQTVFRRQI